MFKLQVYIRIVRLLLEEEDAVTAESYFNRATLIIHGCQDKTTQCERRAKQALSWWPLADAIAPKCFQ